MKITIIGSNGMLSAALTKYFMDLGNEVDVYGLDTPMGYSCTNFIHIDLVKVSLDVVPLKDSDIIIYAAGAGVQAAFVTDSVLMYQLNVKVPIDITLNLKKQNYKGIYISFGSYMEIGVNNEDGKSFTEEEIVCSLLPVTNDYALSKRLYSRYMADLRGGYTYWHFILPNMFSYDDFKPGTRLIPYVLQYLQAYKQGLNPDEPHFSIGTQTREFILMEDVFDIISKSIKLGLASGIYNMGGGTFQSIRELIKVLFNVFNVPCKDSFFGQEQRRDGDVRSLRLNAIKLKNALNVLPSTTLIEALQQKGILPLCTSRK